MKTKLDILKWLTPILVLLATACGHDELVPDDVYVEEPEPPYIELRIAIPIANPPATRTNPMGGEEGNGRERGILNEDRIHDINIFFYRDEAGMNGSDDTEIEYHFFYNILNPDDRLNSKVDSIKEENPHYGERYLQLKFQYWNGGNVSQSNGLKFLAIANVGDLQSAGLKTLGAVRNINLKDYANTWSTTYDANSNNASKMDFFLMSTAYNDEYKFGGQSTGSNTIEKTSDGSFMGTTTLQRMYARLDLWYDKDNIVTDGDNVRELKYQAYNTENYVYIENVLPVNVMQHPSFLFKKVTNEVSSFKKSDFDGLEADRYLWGGKESPSDGPNDGSTFVDLPTNYVVERHTADKATDGSTSPEVLEDWYGSTRVAEVETDIKSADKGSISSYYHGVPNSGNASDDRISVIGYANENTHPIDCYHSNYLTGMAFRAVYVPGKIYSAYNAATGTLVEMSANDRQAFNTDGKTIYRYSPSSDNVVKEEESLYFSDPAALEAYLKEHTEDSAVVTEFTSAHRPDGGELGLICYYNLWLRHYNDEKADPQLAYPMEYATVRNNIYRVKVSFRGPGDPTPTMREPDTMQARIFVRKWNYKEESQIIF